MSIPVAAMRNLEGCPVAAHLSITTLEREPHMPRPITLRDIRMDAEGDEASLTATLVLPNDVELGLIVDHDTDEGEVTVRITRGMDVLGRVEVTV